MQPFEILQLIAEESSQVDASLEFWLMASFAVVVAAHAARDSLTRLSRHGLAGIYLLFCLTTFIKFWADLESLFYYADQLVGTDYEINRPSNGVAMLSRILLYLLGSSCSIAFIYLADRIRPSRDNKLSNPL